MTNACRKDHIRLIQCKLADLGRDAAHAIATGKPDVSCRIQNLNILDGYLKTIYNYIGFDSELTYLYKITIKRTDTNSVKYTITNPGFSITKTSSTDAVGFVELFKDEINNNTTSPEYKADSDGNVLYIYSTDPSANPNDTTTVSITQNPGRTNSISKSNIFNKPEELLNLWNCLTKDELCKIINHSYDLLPNN